MFKKFLRKFAKMRKLREERRLLANFDPVWYLRYYSDLSTFTSAAEASRHYLAHGRAEGRFANAAIAEEADFHRYLTRSEEFDVVAYRLLNPDLGRVFTEDRELILHYLRHGRSEGRPAIFTDDAIAEGEQTDAWCHLFSVSHYSAWISGEVNSPRFHSRGEALAHFRQYGMAELAPIHFDYIFDPDFYRAHYRCRHSSDAELYRDWLEHGIVQGRAPNEARALMPLIGSQQWPDAFDWKSYLTLRRMPSDVSRVGALAALFEDAEWLPASERVLAAPCPELAADFARYQLVRGRFAKANAILKTLAGEPDEWSASLHALSCEIHAAQANQKAALQAGERALTLGHHAWSLLERTVRLALACGGEQRAFALLYAHARDWKGSPAFEVLVLDIAERSFQSAAAAARARFDIGENEIGDRDFTYALNSIASAIGELCLEPAALGPTPGGPVLQLGSRNVRQCTHYRVEQKEQQFARAGIAFDAFPEAELEGFLSALTGARAAIFYRVPATVGVIRAILMARALGIPTFYEIDDLLFDSNHYPPPLASYDGLVDEAAWRDLRFGVPIFRYAMSLCDEAIASTPSLLERMIPLTRKGTGIVVRNGLDSRNRALLLHGGARSKDTSRTRIFYGSGTLAHAEDFVQLAGPPLARLLASHSNVDLVLVGHVPKVPDLSPFTSRVFRFPVIPEITDYWAILAACDIAIAVLRSGPLEECKSEIKWLEAAAAAIPTVASVTATMRQVITDGVDGLLVETPQQWYEALDRLIKDSSLRQLMGEAARDRAVAGYSLDAQAAQIRKTFGEISPRAPGNAKERPRVLVVNVFFAPQSHGGATRVVENNIADLAATGEFELAVLCSEDSNGAPGCLRTSHFGEVPVFRLNIPTTDDIDKRAFNPAVLHGFRVALDRFAPDLVHFHCIQRLSATLVDEVQDRGLPYLVTLHDGWWISPHQFLVDRDGLLCIPQADPFGAMADRASAERTLIRRQELGSRLLGAASVLAVSESFAEIYRSVGITNVRTIANGLPELPAPPPSVYQGGRLRLAHIGGRSSHKGADLVEAALRRRDYQNLSLLMIDGRLASGESVKTVWGTTPVTLAAPTSQARIADLYSHIDVLLAPSRWPESFGLVTREAAHFGCWSVASTLGAMADDVIEAENGYPIDTDTRVQLDSVLERLDREPNRHRRGNIRSLTLRSARQQADDLAAIYRESLAKSDPNSAATTKS